MNNQQFKALADVFPVVHDRIAKAEQRARSGRLPFCMLDQETAERKLPVLVEEVGEVSAELQRELVNVGALRSELLDVAAGALAWYVSLGVEQ